MHTLRQVIAACERQDSHAAILAMINDMLDLDESGVAAPPIVTEDDNEHM